MNKKLKETIVTSKDGTEFTFIHTGNMPDNVIKEVKEMTDKEIELILIGADFEESRVH